MPRRFLKNYLPKPQAVESNRYIKMLGSSIGERIHDPRLWHLNRHGVAAGASIGVFIAFMPVPFQMVLAALAAILFRANLPSAVALVWISNPLTIPPLFYAAYRIGKILLGLPPSNIGNDVSIHWLIESFEYVWEPLLLGCLVLGGFCAGAVYFLVMELWRLHVIRLWRQRRWLRKERHEKRLRKAKQSEAKFTQAELSETTEQATDTVAETPSGHVEQLPLQPRHKR